MISEKIELLGKGLYNNEIPDELTIKSIPTSTELDMVGSEDFEQVMIDKVLPQAVEEKINFAKLLEIDFQWLCRCLRFVNYGPYHETNAIFCSSCGTTSRGKYRVDLRSIECKPLPKGFVNSIKISKDEFIDFSGDIVLQLPTIGEILKAYKDKMFMNAQGELNRGYARLCYMVKSISGETGLDPVQVKMKLESELSSADYLILKEVAADLTNYGLRAGGSTTCPKCQSSDAAFIALVDDRFLRPSLGDLREWKNNKGNGGGKILPRS